MNLGCKIHKSQMSNVKFKIARHVFTLSAPRTIEGMHHQSRFIQQTLADSAVATPRGAAPASCDAQVPLPGARPAQGLRDELVPAIQNREPGSQYGSRVRRAGGCQKIRRGPAI